ncbi:hypothetical protein [Rodentibacter pneumotropicus]|uniref:Lipoprotein n=1 Tax=Rodentibacter pneumotropicus TaxID=758 RepID=A0A1V3K0Q6_9PAST|nr:hypothetical protein [Rodentibacter pneumotropicus]MDC2826450.1 hypothetical protein [Rodentibacter pneumotropicus]NBH76342.1 hypothetical protein [Rodentibacter pneumotropicus]OOF61601.1 hypothetical protein BKL50_07825 [Rodentibacter pneumotropicus]OOF64868.1 hypothetical protein BH925_06015 [Rodentibacter pneumotropicus]OOF66398.1 hypothetical protein BKG95_10740 [Rodentibacter pneumotropicus]
MKKLTFLVSTLIATFLLSGCLTQDLPKCDEKDVKSLLSQIINELLEEKGEEAKFISSKNIIEKGLNKENKIRVCSADIMLSNALEETIIYNIKWQNEKKGMYEVSVLDNE